MKIKYFLVKQNTFLLLIKSLYEIFFLWLWERLDNLFQFLGVVENIGNAVSKGKFVLVVIKLWKINFQVSSQNYTLMNLSWLFSTLHSIPFCSPFLRSCWINVFNSSLELSKKTLSAPSSCKLSYAFSELRAISCLDRKSVSYH
jgi:hypothetical protein